MSSLEQRIVARLLRSIRARRARASQPPVQSGSKLAPARLREATFSDFEGVAELKRRWKMAADSPENWERLWRRNPALARTNSKHPIGWVLDANGEIVGYMGNISSLYRYGNRTLIATTAHGFVVEPGYRALAATLMAAYYRQPSVDLFMSTSSVEATGKMALGFKSEPLLQPAYQTVLVWVIQAHPFAKTLTQKLGVNSRGLSLAAAAAIASDSRLRRRRPAVAADGLVTESELGEAGPEIADLFLNKVSERPRLLAVRDAEMLRWHFEVPSSQDETRLLRYCRNGELQGYAVIRHEAPDANGSRRTILADLLVKNDDSNIADALLMATYQSAGRAGSHILEVSGFPPSIRSRWERWRPYHRQYPASPFHFKAVDTELQRAVADGETWYATPYDGDATLIRPCYSGIPTGSRTLAEPLPSPVQA